MFDDESIDKLEELNEETGGLIIKKKPNPVEAFEFKVPAARPSLFGLDKLAGKLNLRHFHKVNSSSNTRNFSSKKRRKRTAESG